jgi:hypothetical protein
LLNVKWNPGNINTFATKLLSLLFTREELAPGYVEPGPRSKLAALDPTKINLLKGKKNSIKNILIN